MVEVRLESRRARHDGQFAARITPSAAASGVTIQAFDSSPERVSASGEVVVRPADARSVLLDRPAFSVAIDQVVSEARRSVLLEALSDGDVVLAFRDVCKSRA